MVLYAVGLSQIGGAKVGAVTEIGSAKKQWDH